MLPGDQARYLYPLGVQLVGWRLAHQLTTEPGLTALAQALTRRQPAPGRLLHADRGRHQTSLVGRARLEKAQALASSSPPGAPADTAQAEAGGRPLKTELLPQGAAFASFAEAPLQVAYYPHPYVNLARRHSALGYRSPHQFERDCQPSSA